MTTRPPLRLKDDPDVGAALRRDLAQVQRSADLPVGYDVAAGAARFEASIGASGDTGTLNSGNGDLTNAKLTAPTAAKTGALLGFKGTLIACVGALAIGAAILGHGLVAKRSNSTSNNAPIASPSAAKSVSEVAPVASAQSPRNITDPEPATSAVSVALLPLVTEAALKPRAATSANAPSASVPATTKSIQDDKSPARADNPNAPDSQENTMAQEMEQLVRIRGLASSQPAEALRMADEGDRLFTKGLFAQERRAIAVQCLVRLNRTSEAKQRARAFKAAYPRSPFIERMKSLLQDGDE